MMAIIKLDPTPNNDISKSSLLALRDVLNKATTSKQGFVVLSIGLPVLFFFFSTWFVTTKLGMWLISQLSWFFALGLFLFALTIIASVCIAINLTVTKQWWVFRAWLLLRIAHAKDRMKSITTDMRVVTDWLKDADTSRGVLLTMAKPDRKLKADATKITFDDNRHVLMIGGTGAGKGTSFIIPNLLHHNGSVICYDPAGENFQKTAAYRQKVLGSKIILIDPFGVTGELSSNWNPLLEIDFQNDKQAMDKCYALAESLIEQMGENSFFTKSAQELLAMLCAYIGLRSLPENMHLPQIHQLIGGGELDGLWFAMSNCDGMNGIVRRYAQSCMERDLKEFGSVIQTLRTALRFLMSESMRSNLETSSFSMKDLKRENISLYLVVPAGAGETYKGWLRLLFNFAFEAMQDTAIEKPEYPTLFLIDEFPLLGRMERIKRAAGEARKFGVKLFLCAQDIGQLAIYGREWETFVSNAGLCIFFANNDLETQKYVSDRLGQEYSTENKSRVLRKILRTEQVGYATRRNSGKALYFIAGHKPMMLPRATYYEWDMIPKGLEYTAPPLLPKNAIVPQGNIAEIAE